MKKFFVVLLALALVAGSVSAEFVSNAWGRAVFVPLKIVGDNDPATLSQASWGGDYQLNGNFAWTGEQIGFKVNFQFNAPGINDYAFAYWKPAQWFGLSIGRVQWDTLRGSVGFNDSFAGNFTGNKAGDEDAIFSRLYPNHGVVLESNPIEGLHIAAALNAPAPANDPKDDQTTELAFKTGDYVLGYNIDGIGLIRAGFFGLKGERKDNYQGFLGDAGTIQAAFKLTAVDGLGLDIGFTYILDGDNPRNNAKYTAADVTNPIRIALGASYNLDALKIFFHFTGAFGRNEPAAGYTGNDAPLLAFYLNPEYAFDFARIGAGLQLHTYLWGGDGGLGFGGNVYIAKSVGGGEIKAGVALKKEAEFGNTKTDLQFAIPVQITYSVF